MQHYILNLSSETSIIGNQYPQIQKMKPRYDYDGPHTVYKLGRHYQALPDFSPDLDGFVLHSGAKPTDFLSNVFSSPNGFIVSEKVKNILQKLSLPLHSFYPIKLYHKKQQIGNYYWLHVICDLTEIVDYPASAFFIYKDYSFDLGPVQVSSKEMLLLKKSNLKGKNKDHNITIWAKKLKLTQNVKYDFFDIGSFDNNHYISQQLKNIFEKEKVNGIVIHPLLSKLYP
jgi:hypothetical protein